MRTIRNRVFVLVVVGTWLVSPAAPAQPQWTIPPWYYETILVAAVPAGSSTLANEVAVVSAYEDPTQQPPAFAGLFADFNTSSFVASTVHAAALDSHAANAIASQFFPTGDLCVAKNCSGWEGIETYGGVNPTHPTQFKTQQLLSNPAPVSWPTMTASWQPVQAMDIANGILPPPGGPPPPPWWHFDSWMAPTDYLITAEPFQGAIFLGVYALTDPQGVPVQPYLVNFLQTSLTLPCLGLTTSNGKAGAGARTRTDIVFVDGTMTVHAVAFECCGPNGVFGTLDNLQQVSFQVPWPLPTQSISIGGIWISQTANQFLHNVAISVPHPTFPSTRNGKLYILTDRSQPQPWRITVNNHGGGAISHVPTGDPTIPSSSPSHYALKGWNPIVHPNNTPYGWYVVTPGPIQLLEALDASGNTSSIVSYNYLGSPSGTPLGDPGRMGFAPPNSNCRKGAVWVPQTGIGGWIYLFEGDTSNFITWFYYVIPGANHPGLPPLPKPPGTTWPVIGMLRDQKINSKADYGLYFPGY